MVKISLANQVISLIIVLGITSSSALIFYVEDLYEDYLNQQLKIESSNAQRLFDSVIRTQYDINVLRGERWLKELKTQTPDDEKAFIWKNRLRAIIESSIIDEQPVEYSIYGEGYSFTKTVDGPEEGLHSDAIHYQEPQTLIICEETCRTIYSLPFELNGKSFSFGYIYELDDVIYRYSIETDSMVLQSQKIQNGFVNTFITEPNKNTKIKDRFVDEILSGHEQNETNSLGFETNEYLITPLFNNPNTGHVIFSLTDKTSLFGVFSNLKTRFLAVLLLATIFYSLIFWLIVNYLIIAPISQLSKTLPLLGDRRYYDFNHSLLSRKQNAVKDDIDNLYDSVRRVAENLERFDRENNNKRLYLSELMHDFRNRLHQLTLTMRTMNQSSERHYTDSIGSLLPLSETLTRMAAITVDMAKIEAGAATHNSVNTDVVSLLIETYQSTLAMNPNSKVSGHVICHSSIFCSVVLDKSRITSCLHNLIDNSIRHTESGHIVLASRIIRNELTFEVIDTGPGFPDSSVDLTDLYVSESKSSGYGLYMVKNMVDFMGGSLLIDKDVQSGARVAFQVPVTVNRNLSLSEDKYSFIHQCDALVEPGANGEFNVVHTNDISSAIPHQHNFIPYYDCDEPLSVIRDLVTRDSIPFALYGTDRSPGCLASLDRQLGLLNSIDKLPKFDEGKYHAFIVDDEQLILRIHRSMLEASGISVRDFSSGNSLLSHIANNPFSLPDLILLDQNMAGLSGSATADALFVTHPEVPIIILSASEEKVSSPNVVAQMIKPCSDVDIMHCIRFVLSPTPYSDESGIHDYFDFQRLLTFPVEIQKQWHERGKELMRKLSQSSDVEEIKGIVHTIKGNAQTVGVTSIVIVCEEFSLTLSNQDEAGDKERLIDRMTVILNAFENRLNHGESINA